MLPLVDGHDDASDTDTLSAVQIGKAVGAGLALATALYAAFRAGRHAEATAVADAPSGVITPPVPGDDANPDTQMPSAAHEDGPQPASTDAATPDVAAAPGGTAHSERVKAFVFFLAALALAVGAFVVQPPKLPLGNDTDSVSDANVVRLFLPELASDDALEINVWGNGFRPYTYQTEPYGFQSEVLIGIGTKNDKSVGTILVDADFSESEMLDCGLSPIAADSEAATDVSEMLQTWGDVPATHLMTSVPDSFGFACSIRTGGRENTPPDLRNLQ